MDSIVQRCVEEGEEVEGLAEAIEGLLKEMKYNGE